MIVGDIMRVTGARIFSNEVARARTPGKFCFTPGGSMEICQHATTDQVHGLIERRGGATSYRLTDLGRAVSRRCSRDDRCPLSGKAEI